MYRGLVTVFVFVLFVLSCSDSSAPTPPGGGQQFVDCVRTYDLWGFDDDVRSIDELYIYADHKSAIASMSESCKEALEAELLWRNSPLYRVEKGLRATFDDYPEFDCPMPELEYGVEPSYKGDGHSGGCEVLLSVYLEHDSTRYALGLPDLPVTRTPRPTPTPWPTSTPSPVSVVCLTCQWAQEVRTLEARIANECTDTPERAANQYECRAMQQVINLRQSNLGKTRAGVPEYTFLIGESRLHREVTMAEAEDQLLQSPNWHEGLAWIAVMDLIEEYEKTEGSR